MLRPLNDISILYDMSNISTDDRAMSGKFLTWLLIAPGGENAYAADSQASMALTRHPIRLPRTVKQTD